MNCPSCGIENSSERWRCSVCKADLTMHLPNPPVVAELPDALEPSQSEPDPPAPDPTKKCHNCNAEFSCDLNGCPYCGASHMQSNPSVGLRLGLQDSEIEVTSELVVGRDQADGFGSILSHQDLVSRRHFRVTWDGSVARLTDLGSTNGTYCDGERVNPEQEIDLRDGMSIRFGRSGPSVIVRLGGG